jgi:CheY-like chemotaxis protein
VRVGHAFCTIETPMERTEVVGWERPRLSDLPPRPRTGEPPRVLLVDDEDDFLELTAEFLRHLGFEVECAHAAGEAVARAVRNPPDLILLDILLPGTDGLEILEALRREPETAEVPVLACTALGQRESGSLLVRAGFDALVEKPIDWRLLARTLAAALPARPVDDEDDGADQSDDEPDA